MRNQGYRVIKEGLAMSVSMTWIPYEVKEGKHFASGSSLHTALVKAFGDFPIILMNEDIKILEGIEACGYGDVREIITALYDYEKIKLEDCW